MKFFPVMRNALFAPAVAAGVVRTGLAIMGRAAALLLLLMASANQPALGQSQSQTVVIDCLPPWEANGRFLDTTLVKHPSLSLNGFDCGSNCGIGYGLKQVLEKVYGANQDAGIQNVFKKIITQSNEPLLSATSHGNISNNTVYLQARGFVALAAYVLDRNDYDPTTLYPALPSASVAVDSFRTALLNSTSWFINTNLHDVRVQWGTPLTNIARAIDFYLALENAYKHYEPTKYANVNSTSLLSESEKKIFDEFIH